MKNLRRCLLALAAVSLVGCTTFKTVLPIVYPVAVEYATCRLVKAVPGSAGYVGLAADVFTQFGSRTPPAPADLQTALANLPDAGLSESARKLIWAGAMGAYETLYAAAKTETQKANLSAVLTNIGAALRAGSTCAPPLAALGSGATTEPAANELAASVRDYLQRGGAR